MTNDESSEYEMTAWEAVQWSQNKAWMTLALAGLGFYLAYGVGVQHDNIATMSLGLVTLVIADILLFAYASDGRARRAADWLYRKFGTEDYPWSAHDVEVTYRDE